VTAPERRIIRTQVQRRADSRALILDAAVRTLVEEGYRGATTVTIQTRAGVSRGRLLHHFPSREQLLIAAAHHLVTEHLTQMEAQLADSVDGRLHGARRIDRATELLWATFHRPYFWAVMELWIAARTDTVLREELVAAERRLGRAVEDVVDAMYGPELTGRPAWPDVRRLLLSSMRGVTMTYAIQPRDPARDPHLALWQQAARSMLLDG
jgi:AcrR family transcriptional regulator